MAPCQLPKKHSVNGQVTVISHIVKFANYCEEVHPNNYHQKWDRFNEPAHKTVDGKYGLTLTCAACSSSR